MEVDQAPTIAHGHPGTAVGDLFPLGNSVFGCVLGALSAQFGQENSVATPQVMSPINLMARKGQRGRTEEEVPC